MPDDILAVSFVGGLAHTMIFPVAIIPRILQITQIVTVIEMTSSSPPYPSSSNVLFLVQGNQIDFLPALASALFRILAHCGAEIVQIGRIAKERLTPWTERREFTMVQWMLSKDLLEEVPGDCCPDG